jgi:hypothetical protein
MDLNTKCLFTGGQNLFVRTDRIESIEFLKLGDETEVIVLLENRDSPLTSSHHRDVEAFSRLVGRSDPDGQTYDPLKE